MAQGNDRSALTDNEAYGLVRYYVHSFWPEYKRSISGMDEEDAVQDISMKILKRSDNKDYDPDWEPGEVAHLKRASGAPYKDVDTSYMLDSDYDPDYPYDSLYHIMNKPKVSYVDRYNGRTTSKKYYIMSMVKNSLIDMTRKKDSTKYSVSLDEPVSNDGDSRTTRGDLIADPDTVEKEIDASELKQILRDILSDLSTSPLSDRIVGWNPVSGEYNTDGSQKETPLTARDIGLLLMNGYSKDDVLKMYHDSRTGEPISMSTLSKKWAMALSLIKSACANSEVLRDAGYLKGFMG